MDSKPLLTVIIPTKDRADYLRHTLRTCSIQEYENLEVIVSDDGSADHTRDVVSDASRADPRIRYVTPGSNAGMRENFEFALRQVRPGYVIALGGDDGLLPHAAIGMLEALRATGRELLAWPAPVYSYAGARTSRGQLMMYRGAGTRIVDAAAFLQRQVENLNYLGDLESPMFYVKGVASTVLVDRVKSRSPDGRFYACPTPDGYSGIVLAGEVESYAFSGKPFSIYGLSPTSQGMAYLAGDEESKQRSESFFRSASESPMHDKLGGQPYSPLIAVMTADYLLTAAELPGWPGRVPPIDFRRLLSKSLGELAHGLFSESRMTRELKILLGIARAHGLEQYLRDEVRRTRKFAKKQQLEGNAISPRQWFLDGEMYGLRNIFDAAYFAYCAYEFVPKASLSTLFDAVRNSIRYRLRSVRRGDPFPGESTWYTSAESP